MNYRQSLSEMILLTNQNIFYLLVMATFLHICQARSLVNESSGANTTDGSLWQPKVGTRSEWMACSGMPKDVCETIKIKKQELQRILAQKFGLDLIANVHHLQDSSPNDSDEGQCIMYTEEQLDIMIAEAKNEEKATSTHRSKRTLIDLKKYPFTNYWSMPIPYMFDGTHDDRQKTKIRGAFQHWTDNTCIRFKELPTNAPFDSNYILMTNQGTGCYSNLGRISSIDPQQINLASNCVESFGTVLHEIGHSLGLVHEQQRIDRNDSVRILWSNIQRVAWSEYMEAYTDALGLPYNYGSIMHYPSKNGFSVNGSDTMIALEPLYQMNMGQIVDLSFHDRKIINLAYCKGICATPLSQPCQRGGYQNPNNCSACICPGGFSGQYCNEIARPQNANCGAILNIVSGTEQVIKSPGYDDTGYSDQQECTWWIKAPENYKLQLEFIGSFSIICWESVCYHWAEIKYKKEIGLEGARFCCYSRPNNAVISESNEMMVIFRSNYTLDPTWQPYRLGFQAIVKTIPPVSSSSSPTTTPASNSRTSSPVSTKKTSSPTLTLTFRTSTLTSIYTTSASTANSPTTTKSSTSTKTPTNTTMGLTTTRATTSVPPVSSSSSPTSTPASNSRTSSTEMTSSSAITKTSSNLTSRGTTSTSTANSPTTTESLTSTKAPTTTATRVTTTGATTLGNATAPCGNRKSLFRCSFENTSTGNSLCGMTQDKTDQFDWTVYHDPTSSDATGPDAPYDGDFYIYIEASSPRQPKDEARLFFPRLNFAGEVCVNFYYHMFGQHVDTLKLVRITNSQRTDVWTRSGQSGDSWLQASVGVNLSSCSLLQFIGIRGNDYSGDIGLDNIEVTSGP